MSKKHIYRIAEGLQRQLRAFSQDQLGQAPRVFLDAWASLWLWSQSGEKVWRITEEQADRLLDDPLRADLPLATAPTRGAAVCYQLPDYESWIVLARHQTKTFIQVWGELGWAYAQPVLTYCTPLETGALSAGYLNLLDQPHPPDIHLRPGRGLISGQLNEAQIVEEDFRLFLAIAQHYRP